MGGGKSDNLPKLPEGSRFRQWKIIKRLGEGSFGAVYQVADAKTGAEAAMKVESTNEEESMIKMEVRKLRIFYCLC